MPQQSKLHQTIGPAVYLAALGLPWAQQYGGRYRRRGALAAPQLDLPPSSLAVGKYE
jgi:hypothetical protein